MKKIISGKVYNTDTAKKIATFCPDIAKGDFAYYEETLHLKRTGEYFLHGKGGGLSRYAKNLGGDSWGPGEAIQPLTYAEAKAWAESRLEADEYEAIFGEIEEDETKTNLMLSIKAENVEKIKRHAQAHGVGVSELIDEFIEGL